MCRFCLASSSCVKDTPRFASGRSAASVFFGHLVHSHPPFRLMTVGLVIWVIACLLSGLSPNFYVLLVARILSGVGEASFQTVVPPYIDSNAPTSKRGLWLSIFYLGIPVGSAGKRAACAIGRRVTRDVRIPRSGLRLWRHRWLCHVLAIGFPA